MLVKGGENPECPVAVLAPLLWERLKGTTHPPCILLQAPARYCLKPHSSGSMELVGRQEKDPGLQVDSGNRVQSLGAPLSPGCQVWGITVPLTAGWPRPPPSRCSFDLPPAQDGVLGQGICPAVLPQTLREAVSQAHRG